MVTDIKKPDWICQEPHPGYECYLKEDNSIGYYLPIKYGRAWWKIKSSRIVPFSGYAEEKELKLSDWWMKISFTYHGWLEQFWELETEHWWKKVTEEEYMKVIMEEGRGAIKGNSRI